MKKEFIFLLLILILTQTTFNQLIRPNYVYEEIVLGIHDYYNSTCILFLHTIADPIESQGIL